MNRPTKKRTPNPKKAQVQLRVDTEFLARIDERAESLHLDRTKYVLGVVKQDIEKGGDFTISPRPAPVAERYKIPPGSSAMNEGPK